MKTLFLVWREPIRQEWVPVGKLSRKVDHYVFQYTKGAQKNSTFRPLTSFPSIDVKYESDKLFPLFANRIPEASSSDYPHYLEWLDVANGDDRLALLARSGGRRATDAYEVFACPELEADGCYLIYFFAHGIRHLHSTVQDRIAKIKEGERLLLQWDIQNRHDPNAFSLRTDESISGQSGDRMIVGYCPRYLLPDAFELLFSCSNEFTVTVEKVNDAPAPQQMRLLCKLTACWPTEFKPCSTELYQPIEKSVSTTMDQVSKAQLST